MKCSLPHRDRDLLRYNGRIERIVFRIAQDLLGPSSLVFGFSPLLAVVVPAGICALAGFFLLRRAA